MGRLTGDRGKSTGFWDKRGGAEKTLCACYANLRSTITPKEKNMEIELDDVVACLRETHCFIDELQAPSEAGIYGVFACFPGILAPFPVGNDGLIYIGVSSNLAERECEHHFSSDRTGFSTLRRTLGAILREKLCLVPIPRSPGSRGCVYRFESEGEDRLTDWMRANLEVGVCCTGDPKMVECELIALLKPVLNLTKWQNPHRKEIKRLRKQCADDAQIQK